MWVKPLLTLLRGTLWDKGHAGGNAMITVHSMSWQNGTSGVPMVCAGTLQCLQGAQSICSLGFEELILFSLLWRSCSPSSWDSCSWRVKSCWCPFRTDQHQLWDMKHENASLKAVFLKL